MKKIIIFLKLNWIKILIITFFALALGGAIYFVYSGVGNLMQLESFSRRQLSAQFGLLMIVFTLVHIISLPLSLALNYYFLQGGFSRLGQGKISLAKADVKWDEVVGMEEAKKDAWELVELLKDRGKLKRTGGKIIKGMLMMGPPGCGKTYLAKAIATECGLPMVSATGSEFIGMFVGVGTSRMKSLFKEARALAAMHGGCLIFIDEIDSFARPRQADQGFGGTMDRNATINQFLTELDGLRKAENNITILGATNCEEHELDSAIIRPGRLERKINVTRPNLKEREEIFTLYLKKVEYNHETIDVKLLARKTVWFTPAEIESMVREAALLSQRDNHDKIEKEDINEAYERVSFGQKSNAAQPEKDKLWTAYHEAGHAIIYYLLSTEEDVMKATIIPRRGMLGYVFARAKEESYQRTLEDYLASIKISLASYVAEKKKFGTTGSGVGGGRGSDFAQALQTANHMVWSLGMGSSGLIGDFSSMSDYRMGTLMSEEIKNKLSNDVQNILQECLQDVERIINENWDALEHFAQQLYIKEELDYDEIAEIFDKKFNLQRPVSPHAVPEHISTQKKDYRRSLPKGPDKLKL